VFDGIFADIGDEQSIEQSLSTFSSHMTNIIRIVDQVDSKSLVLLDELAAGTDPAEGAALARAILGKLLDAGALTVATTHHGELKAYAHATDRVMNASVEFNLETLSPTYHLSIGLPGRSNALEIAQRLGMPTSLIDAARASIGPEQLQVEEMLSDIRREREQAADARRSEQQARLEAEEIREKLAEKLDAAEDQRADMFERAQAEIAADVDRARELLQSAEREIEAQRLAAAADKLKRAADEAARVAARAHARPPGRRREPRVHALSSGPPPEEIRTGDMVWLRGMDRWGEAMHEPDEKGEVEIRLGALRSRIKLAQVERVQRPAASKAQGSITTDLGPLPSVAIETDVRGQTIDEAMPAIERYIDSAFRAGLPWTRIIHGKGTGVLRREVRSFLAQNPLVASYEEAQQHEGGAGVTIAHLAI
jgi:DNA mismatch repair protein MutS2